MPGRVFTPDELRQFERRIKSNVNSRGATFRLCTYVQPATLTELLVHIWGTGRPKIGHVTAASVIDGYLDWVDADRPGMLTAA